MVWTASCRLTAACVLAGSYVLAAYIKALAHAARRRARHDFARERAGAAADAKARRAWAEVSFILNKQGA